jgi:hypothetical protein
MSSILKAKARKLVCHSYEERVIENEIKYEEGEAFATKEYIFENQKTDAINIVNTFYQNKDMVAISISKKTKVGMDGLMIEIIKLMTTHEDDDFIVDYKNVRIITGMSNVKWQDELKGRCPSIFRTNVFHHGQILNANLKNLQNALIIIDEIDTGNKQNQRLDKVLKEAGLLNLNYLIDNKIRFIFTSATIIKEIYDLTRWGEKYHMHYRMTIPSSYIGHIDFLNMNILKNSFVLNTKKNVEKWIQEDIINYYGNDYRIHLVRIREENDKKITCKELIEEVCTDNGIQYHTHTSDDRIDSDELKKLFGLSLSRHHVIMIKGFYRRADFIPNIWKLKIGAVHELFTNIDDYNVQMQGLIGRMSGYWRESIEKGHKIGPYRMCVQAVINYEKIYINPFDKTSVIKTSTLTKKKNKIIKMKDTILTPSNVEGIIDAGLPKLEEECIWNIEMYEFTTETEIKDFFKSNNIAYRRGESKVSENGFIMSSTTGDKKILDYSKIKQEMKSWNILSNFDITEKHKGKVYTRVYPCYQDTKNPNSLMFICRIIKRKEN